MCSCSKHEGGPLYETALLCVCCNPGVEKYAGAIKILFDPKSSRADLISIKVRWLGPQANQPCNPWLCLAAISCTELSQLGAGAPETLSAYQAFIPIH